MAGEVSMAMARSWWAAMPLARAENSSSSPCSSMSFMISRRLASRLAERVSGRLSSGRRKSSALGSCVMSRGSLPLPRKLACCPGVVEPSAMTCGRATNVGTPLFDGDRRSTIEP
jgi:hypothetical protein